MEKQLMTTVRCKKDLVNDRGIRDFTKGKEYTGQICNILESLVVNDDWNVAHRLGNWAKHFTDVSMHNGKPTIKNG